MIAERGGLKPRDDQGTNVRISTVAANRLAHSVAAHISSKLNAMRPFGGIVEDGKERLPMWVKPCGSYWLAAAR